MRAVICPAYLPNVAYFAYLTKQETSYFATDTHYQKQTFRNRSEIYGANGKLNLIIPIIHKKQTFQLDQDVEISYEINWQKEHWKSICSAYRSSPFFEYYEADLDPFFDKKTKSLFDFNLSLIEKIMMLLELPYSFQKISFNKEKDQRIDELLLAKKRPVIQQEKYIQVFVSKLGFIPNLSILDALFNLGPNCAFYIKNAKTPI
jgi:hypothetical protein